jgi:hypothetical protein
MKQQSASTFPNHKFDFDDHARVIPIGKCGLIKGIRYRKSDDIWLYRLSGLKQPKTWWQEDQLELSAE